MALSLTWGPVMAFSLPWAGRGHLLMPIWGPFGPLRLYHCYGGPLKCYYNMFLYSLFILVRLLKIYTQTVSLNSPKHMVLGFYLRGHNPSIQDIVTSVIVNVYR